mgnify:CR=1 FL=1
MNRMIRDTDFHLHNSYTFWISRLASLMQEQFNQQLQESGITWPQWMVLNVLHHDLAQTPAQIAENIGVDRSAITRLVDRLEKKGLVERQHDGLDRRSIKVLMKLNGKRLMDQVNEAARQHQERFLSELPPEALPQLRGNLQSMLGAGGVQSNELWRRL